MNFENFVRDGKIIFEGKEHAFHFENNILTIFSNDIGSDWNNYSNAFFRSKNSNIEKSTYYGTTLQGNSICFINVELTKKGRSFFKGYVPAYIYGKDNGYIPAPRAINFTSMQFRGKCIDQLYSPKFLIESQKITKRLTPQFKFHNSKALLRKLNVNSDIFNFGIMWNISSKEINIPIKLKSQIWIAFNEKKQVDDIIEYYKSMYELMCFLYNRNIIEFDEIKLTSKIWLSKSKFDSWKNKKRKLVTTNYYLHINLPKDKKIDLSDINLSLSLDTLVNHFENLYNILSKEKNTLFSYPNNSYEDSHVDSYQFIKIASSFEGQFDKLHPNYKANKYKKYKVIKNNILNYISEMKTPDLSSAEIGYINNFYDTINNLDGALHEQISSSLKEFIKPLEKTKQRLFVNYNITSVSNGSLAQAFSQKRNEITHSALSKKFSNVEIVSYLLVKRLVHCIILKRSNFTTDEITEIINRIFQI